MNPNRTILRIVILTLLFVYLSSPSGQLLHGSIESVAGISVIRSFSGPEPASQPTELTFSEVKTYSYMASYRHAIPKPDAYIVLRSKAQNVTGIPVDGTTYSVGDALGNARVVYIGSDSTFAPRGVVAGTRFYHRIFSVNGTAGSEDYLQNMPLSGYVVTPPNMIGEYYAGINSNGIGFLEQLQDRIRPHTSLPYASYTNLMINGFEAQDTTGGQKVVYCVYSGFAHVYNEPFGWIGSPGGTLSREHTFAHSWYPTHPSNTGIEYSDFYNLFPTHQNNANNRRSNHPLGIVQHVTYQFMDGKLGTDAQGNTVYEPRNKHKGDAARALFYMVTRYHNWDGYQWFLPDRQNQDVLKLWHFTDPPDAWEIARNDYIHSKQGNRNPYVDSIHFALRIDFRTMQSLNIPQTYAPQLEIKVYPNPFDQKVFLTLTLVNPQHFKVTLYKLSGEIAKSFEIEANSGTSEIPVNLSDFACGIYILTITSEHIQHSIRIIKH